jgi:WD40 repeat protein
MFAFNPEKPNYELIVENVDITAHVILSLINVETKLKCPKWQSTLEIFICKSYLGLENDVKLLYDLKVPSEGFDLLLRVLSEYDLAQNRNLIRLLKRNLPVPLDECDNLFVGWDHQFLRELRKIRFIVTAGERGFINIFDADTTNLIVTIKFKKVSVYNICLTSDNKKLLAKCDDCIRIWDINDFKPKLVHIIKSSSSFHKWMVISPDDKLVVNVFEPDDITIWSIETGKLIWQGSLLAANSASFSSDNRQIICTSLWNNNYYRIFDISLSNSDHIEKCVASQEINCRERIAIARFSLDNSKIIVGTMTSSDIQIRNAISGDLIKILKGHTNSISDVRFFSRDNKIISIDLSGQIIIWDADTGAIVSKKHFGLCNNYVINMTRDEMEIYILDYSPVKIWNLETDKCYRINVSHKKENYYQTSCIAFSF